MKTNANSSKSCRVEPETPHGGASNPERIKATYSDEVIGMLNDVWIKKRLAECKDLRARACLMDKDEFYIMQLALQGMQRHLLKKVKKMETKQ